MQELLTPIQTPTARQWLTNTDAKSDLVWSALLSTIDGHRNIVELESVARALGLEAGALERLRQRGLIDYLNSPPQSSRSGVAFTTQRRDGVEAPSRSGHAGDASSARSSTYLR